MNADFLDTAAELQQHMIEQALANRPAPSMVYTGECHYCEEPIDKGHFARMNAEPTMKKWCGLRSSAL